MLLVSRTPFLSIVQALAHGNNVGQCGSPLFSPERAVSQEKLERMLPLAHIETGDSSCVGAQGVQCAHEALCSVG